VRWLIPILALAAVALAVSPPKTVLEISYVSGGYVGVRNTSDIFEWLFLKSMLWNCAPEPYWPVVPLCSAYGMMVVPFREYRFKQATAIFNYTRAPTPQDWDVLKWRMQASLSIEEMEKRFGLGIKYGISFLVVFGSEPLVNWSRVFYKGYDKRRGVYVYWWKEPYAVAGMHSVVVFFRWGISRTELCINVERLQAERDDGWWEDYYIRCFNWNKPPINFTVVARVNSYSIYVDGVSVYEGRGSGEAWLYAGPIFTLAEYSSATAAFVDANYPTLWKTGEPIKVWLFVGNDTLKLPDYAYPYVGVSRVDADTENLAARVSPSPDGSTVVSPPYWRYGEQVVWLYNFTGAVTVRVGSEVYELPNGTLLLAPGRSCTASGRVYRVLGDAFVALGNGSVDCREWRVAVELPDGSEVVVYAPNGTTFEYTPPPLDLGNGTRLRAIPIRLYATGPARVRATYEDREYLLTFVGAAVECLTSNCTQYVLHNFTEAVWAPEGRLVAVEKYAVLHNGTRLVARAIAVADGPKRVPFSISREYRVVVIAPNGTAERWWPEGRALAISPYTLEYNNGTRVEVEGLNTTVTRPLEVKLNYTVYYWVSLTTSFNKTEGWAKRGVLINVSLPTFVDLGNGTALRSPNGTCAFRVEGPKACTIVYRERLYYVEVVGVTEWRGWVKEGAQMPLNETVIENVKYVPTQPYIEVRGPLSVKPKYTAYYYVQFNDALGLPNPWVSVELCGRRFATDEVGRVYAVVETDERCMPKANAPPLGPYSLAIIGVVAAIAAVVAARRLKKR